ncbi:hypothetical protein C8R43DRAFT_119980 [Mycena crocata]|nr:hypothetical protein C8R43DRAFT_119980 [Mycena crocata]
MENGKYARHMPFRPGSQPKGTLNVDLGSTLDVPKDLPKKSKPPRGDEFDSDDDELDMLPRSSQPKPPKRDMDDVIRGMHFKKKRKTDADGNDATLPTSKENTERSRDRKVVSDPRAVDNRKNAVASGSKPGNLPLREQASNRNQSSSDAGGKYSSNQAAKPTRPKPRPLATKPALRSPKSSATSSFSGEAPSPKLERQEKKLHKSNTFPVLSPPSDTKGKGKGRERTGRVTEKSSPLPPLDINGKGKAKERGPKTAYPVPSPLSSPSKRSEDFLPSPLGTPDPKRSRSKLAASDFPAPSPLRQEAKLKKKETRPFPMNTQFFEDSPGPSSGKRQSLGSDNDDKRDRKRYKQQAEYVSSSSTRG